MAAYGCSGCGVNWPNIAKYSDCPLCDGKAAYSYIAKPDYADATEAEEYIREAKAREAAAELARGDASPAHANRVERYLNLGFSEVDAQVLALATRVHVDSIGRQWIRHVNHLDVARALASGCSHALAVEIFS